MVPLTNSTTKIRIDPEDEIGLLGVFDTSETVAMTINYLVTIADDDDVELIEDSEKETGLTPVIIFVIIICSIFGLILLLAAACFFIIKAFRGSRKTLIRMNNEI